MYLLVLYNITWILHKLHGIIKFGITFLWVLSTLLPFNFKLWIVDLFTAIMLTLFFWLFVVFVCRKSQQRVYFSPWLELPHQWWRDATDEILFTKILSTSRQLCEYAGCVTVMWLVSWYSCDSKKHQLVTVITMELIFLLSLQVRYLHDFADRLELNVQFQNEITEITRDQNGTGMFQLRNQNGTSYSCRVVIIRFGIY